MQCSEELWLKRAKGGAYEGLFGQESGRYATVHQKPIGLGTCGLCVCVCVCMVVCYQYSGIIERKNMAKILIEVEKSPFQLDFQLFTSRVHGWRKSYTIWEYDHHIHSSYFFAIRFSTSEMVLNVFHHQHPPRLFLWLPRVSSST